VPPILSTASLGSKYEHESFPLTVDDTGFPAKGLRGELNQDHVRSDHLPSLDAADGLTPSDDRWLASAVSQGSTHPCDISEHFVKRIQKSLKTARDSLLHSDRKGYQK